MLFVGRYFNFQIQPISREQIHWHEGKQVKYIVISKMGNLISLRAYPRVDLTLLTRAITLLSRFNFNIKQQSLDINYASRTKKNAIGKKHFTIRLKVPTLGWSLPMHYLCIRTCCNSTSETATFTSNITINTTTTNITIEHHNYYTKSHNITDK